MASEPMPSSNVEYVGPFQRHDVVVRGRQVPLLEAHPTDDGHIHLVLDHRFGLDLTLLDAERVVPFLADVIAIAMGYTCHPDAEDDPSNWRRHPFPVMTGLVMPEGDERP